MGPGSPASTRCHWCSSQNQRTQHQARWEKKKSASLVGEFCKIPGSFLLKSTNKPVSTPLKHFPFYPAFCVKKKCHWTLPIYKACRSLLTLPVYSWPPSLSAISSSQWFEMGLSGKERARDKLFPYFFPPLSPFSPRLLTPEYSLDGRAGKQHSRRHISRQGCHSHPEPLPGRTSHSGGRL